MTAPTRWWWVRHAPVPGAPGTIFGQMDASCDTSDGAAFRALAALLPTDAVWVVSPLCRTVETRDAIAAAGLGAAEPVVEPDLSEQHFGRWQGLSWPAMQARDPDAYARFWADPLRIAPPGGESYTDQMARVAAAIDRLTEVYAGRTVVCISHGGTIRAAVAHALGLRPEAAMAIAVDNLSITRLARVQDGGPARHRGAWHVETVNAPCRWTG